MARSVEQLKDQARRAEKREEWSRAIELYLEALETSEETGDLSLDLSLYNRIGDLHRRLGETEEAATFYRKAVDQYAEQGLHTGAVALCNKILRLAPDRADIHRVLGRLHASSGLEAEARNAFRQYVERMEEGGDEAAAQDARVELARLVGDVELLEDAVGRMAASGREEAAREAVAEARDEARSSPGDPDPRLAGLAEEVGLAAEPGTEDASAAGSEPDAAPDGAEAETAGAGTADDDRPDATVGNAGDVAGGEAAADGAGATAGDAGGSTASAGEDGAGEDADGDADEAAADEEDVAGVDLDEILLHEPSQPSPATAAGEDADAADEEADAADEEGGGEHAGERPDAEEASDDEAAAPAVGGKGEPGPGPAAEPPDEAPEEAPEDEPVDLGGRIRRRLEAGGGAPRVDERRPRDAPDFDDMLVGFRAQAAETSGRADPDAHVELGVALQQMGLLDDAIREFQVAARAAEPPLRAFELLGESFLEKGLHSVAVRVLNRALRLPGYSDHELLGILYQLGVAYQSVEDHADALDCYERVYSVDIDFRDVAERMETVRSSV